MNHPVQASDLARLTALQLRDALASGEVSAVAATRHFLDVTQRRDPELGAFISVEPEAALARAEQLDRGFRDSGPVGSLHGMPLAFKDLVDVAGMRTTFGSRTAVDAPPADPKNSQLEYLLIDRQLRVEDQSTSSYSHFVVHLGNQAAVDDESTTRGPARLRPLRCTIVAPR